MFSPYYHWASRSRLRREGRAAEADDHVALNLALYGDTRRWAMTERSAASLRRDRHTLSIARSHVHWNGQALTVEIDEWASPWPRRLRGTLRIFPQALSRHVSALDAEGAHRWAPIAPCARAELHLSEPALRWSGVAYLDSNEGDEPVTVPFSHWHWQRAALPDGGTAVVYDVVRKSREACEAHQAHEAHEADKTRAGKGTEAGASAATIAMHFDARGGERAIDSVPPAHDLPHTSWGIQRRARSETPVVVQQSLENTPFYARSLLELGWKGRRVPAVHETLSIPRLASPWVRMLLPARMPRTG